MKRFLAIKTSKFFSKNPSMVSLTFTAWKILEVGKYEKVKKV